MVQHMKICPCNPPYKLREKNGTIIPLDSEEAFNKVLYLFMINVSKRSGIPGIYLNLIKAIYSKPIIKLNGEKFKAIPLKSDKALHSLHVYSTSS